MDGSVSPVNCRLAQADDDAAGANANQDDIWGSDGDAGGLRPGMDIDDIAGLLDLLDGPNSANGQ